MKPLPVILLALLCAAQLGTKLKWNPQTEQFIGHDAANAMLTRISHNGWAL